MLRERSDIKSSAGIDEPHARRVHHDHTAVGRRIPGEHAGVDKTGQSRTVRSFAVYTSCPRPMPEDRLLFVVSYLNHAPRQAAHGATSGLIQSSVSTWLNILIPVPRADGLVPSRTLDGLWTWIGDPDAPVVTTVTFPLFMAAPGAPSRAPKTQVNRKTPWSGKAHQHTVNSALLADRTTRIWCLSDIDEGSAHEQPIADATSYPLPAGGELLQDLGHLEFVLPDVTMLMLHKNAEGQPLTDDQKTTNRQIGRRQGVIEHVISTIQYCAILQTDLHLRADHIRDTVMEIAYGFYNLRGSASFVA